MISSLRGSASPVPTPCAGAAAGRRTRQRSKSVIGFRTGEATIAFPASWVIPDDSRPFAWLRTGANPAARSLPEPRKALAIGRRGGNATRARAGRQHGCSARVLVDRQAHIENATSHAGASGATPHDPALVQHRDGVGAAHGRESKAGHHGGTVDHQVSNARCTTCSSSASRWEAASRSLAQTWLRPQRAGCSPFATHLTRSQGARTPDHVQMRVPRKAHANSADHRRRTVGRTRSDSWRTTRSAFVTELIKRGLDDERR